MSDEVWSFHIVPDVLRAVVSERERMLWCDAMTAAGTTRQVEVSRYIQLTYISTVHVRVERYEV